MELVNALYKYTDGPFNKEYSMGVMKDLIKLLAPFAPQTKTAGPTDLWPARKG